MSLMVIGVLVVMVGGAVALVNRQFHATVNQEQEEIAFHVAEAGVHYTLFLLNSHTYSMQDLLSTNSIQKDIPDPATDETVGTATLAFTQPEGFAAGEQITVAAVGRDAAGRACQRVNARIALGNADNPFTITSWDHPAQCADIESAGTPTPSPTFTPTPTPSPTPPPGGAIVQDDWSGTGTVNNTNPDIGPDGATWSLAAGIFTRNDGVLEAGGADTSLVVIETNTTDITIKTKVLHGGHIADGGGHSSIAARYNDQNGTYIVGFVAEDCGACIAVTDGVSIFDILASGENFSVTVGQEYDLTLTLEGSTIQFQVAGSDGTTTMEAESFINIDQTQHGVRAWGGGSAPDIATAYETVSME